MKKVKTSDEDASDESGLKIGRIRPNLTGVPLAVSLRYTADVGGYRGVFLMLGVVLTDG